MHDILPIEQEILIPIENGALKADLFIPEKPKGLVIFSHGSGSSRKSPRNRYVAEHLAGHSLASLLADLLLPEEDFLVSNRFDINMLTQRLISVTRHAWKHKYLAKLPTGYFGASTGAASAIKAAIHFGPRIKAVVSRGGRPDLAMSAVSLLDAPTLLLVGGLDFPVVEMNERAFKAMSCKKEMKLVPGATHLFEEPGTLELVAEAAAEWFEHNLQ